MNKSITRYIISFIFIAIAVGMICQDQYIDLLKRVSLIDLLVAVLISACLAFISGFTMKYITAKQYNINIGFLDTLTLPMMMNLWGFIIPIRGGMLYSIFFLKAKYKVKIVQGASMTIYIYMISFVIMGLLGLYCTISQNIFFSILTLVSIGMILSPFLMSKLNYIFQKLSFDRIALLKKFQNIIDLVVTGSSLPWANIKTTLTVSMLVFARICCRTLRFYWCVRVFDFDIPFGAIIVMSLTVEFLKIMVRVSPGNLGVNEVVSGSMIGLLGQSTEEGLLVALFSRFSNIILTFTVGAIAVVCNMHYFDVKNIKNLWQKVKST